MGRQWRRGEPHRLLADPTVFALAEEAFENVLPARHLRREASTSVLRLGEADGGVELITLASSVEIGAEVLVGLPSSEIVLATERPAGLSASNVLPARVEAIRASDGWGLVQTRLARRPAAGQRRGGRDDARGARHRAGQRRLPGDQGDVVPALRRRLTQEKSPPPESREAGRNTRLRWARSPRR